MVSGRHTELWSDAIGANGSVVAYGHYGRPVLAFPAERGNAVGVRATAAWSARSTSCSRAAA